MTAALLAFLLTCAAEVTGLPLPGDGPPPVLRASEVAGGYLGVYGWKENVVIVRSDLSRDRLVRVLGHELTHFLQARAGYRYQAPRDPVLEAQATAAGEACTRRWLRRF